MSAIFSGFGYENPDGVEAGALEMDTIIFNAVESPILPDFGKKPVVEKIVTEGADRVAFFRQYTIPEPLRFFGLASASTLQVALRWQEQLRRTAGRKQAGFTFEPMILRISEPMARIATSQLTTVGFDSVVGSYTVQFACMIEAST
jgi:hypothetical protein